MIEHTILNNLTSWLFQDIHYTEVNTNALSKFKLHENGGNSLVFTNADTAIKIGDDYAYLAFIRWANKNSHPALPKIHHISHNKNKFFVILERLSENTDESIHVDQQSEIQHLNISYEDRDIIDTIWRNWSIHTNISLDMNYFNFMRRGDQLVVTDPLYPVHFVDD